MRQRPLQIAPYPRDMAEILRFAVAAIETRDVGEMYSARYRAGGTTLVIAGDITVADATTLVRNVFGRWSGSAPSAVKVVDAPAGSPSSTLVICNCPTSR